MLHKNTQNHHKNPDKLIVFVSILDVQSTAREELHYPQRGGSTDCSLLRQTVRTVTSKYPALTFPNVSLVLTKSGKLNER